MIILKAGDRLPTVAVVQNRLNEHGHSSEFITVDGIFGPKTKRAVQDFERAKGLTPDGIVSGDDWNSIVGKQWQVIDSVDVTEFDDPKHAPTDQLDLQGYGQKLLLQYGQCQGIFHVVHTIQSSASAGNVVLLRFHGHGSPGIMIVAAGRMGQGSALNSRWGPKFFAHMSGLRGIFAPFGSVEMHGCRVAAGPHGKALISGLADAFGVPVTAAKVTQYGGGGDSTFQFEGAVDTACPGGISLKAWAQAKCNQSLVPV